MYSRLKKRPLALNMDDLKIEDLVDLGLLDEGSLFVRIAECVTGFFWLKLILLLRLVQLMLKLCQRNIV